jgi:NitT/TauT family transport system permease protein
VCFFPILVSVVAGFHATDRDRLDMKKAFGATEWQPRVRLRIPSPLVLIFAGLEIAAVLAVIGAIVGEFVAAQVGLGYLIVALNFSLDVPGAFAGLDVLSAIGLHGAMRFAAHRHIFWIRRNEAPVLV